MSRKPLKVSLWKKMKTRFSKSSILSDGTANSSGPSAGVATPPVRSAMTETPTDRSDNHAPAAVTSAISLMTSDPPERTSGIASETPVVQSASRQQWLVAAQVALDLLGTLLSMAPVHGLDGMVTFASKALSQVAMAASNADDLKRLTDVVTRLQKSLFPDSDHPQPLPKHINQRIQSTLKNLGSITSSAKEVESKGKITSFFGASMNAGTITQLFQAVQNGLDEFMLNGVLNVEITVWDLLKHEEQKSLESSLQNVLQAQWDHLDYRIVECMAGTREDILESIYQWHDTPDTESICWLRGMAGVGKTAIAKSVCKSTTGSKHILGGSFFCSRRGDAALSDVTRIFPSLALQLCKNVPDFHQKLLSTWQRLPTVYDIPTAPADQFVTLILNPLLHCCEDDIIVLVIDALDECAVLDAAEQLFQSISDRVVEAPHLKILVTSRPETEILTTFSDLAIPPHTLILPRKNHEDKTESDLTIFFAKTLQELARKNHARDQQTLNFPSDKLVMDLVNKAQGSFIYARIVCNAAKDSGLSYRDMASHFAKGESNHAGLKSIYELYNLILRRSIERTGSLPEEKELLYSILGAIIHLQTPLSIRDLANLMDVSAGDVFKHLDRIRSILYVAETIDSPERIQTIHATLDDFLVGRSREISESILPTINPAEQHWKITLSAFTLMDGLTYNPCMLDRFTFNPTLELVNKHISGSLSYASQFWADHLVHCVVDATKSHGLLNDIQKFAANKILLWVETCSLLGHVDSVLHSLHVIFQNKNWSYQLEQLQLAPAERKISVLEIFQDLYRLVSMYHEPLQYQAAQLYLSAFKMLPTQSPIYCQYSDSISVEAGVELQHGRRPTWDPCLHVWSIQSGKLLAVVPAANAINYVAALSWADLTVTICVWDMIEGSLKWSKKIVDVQEANKAHLYSSQHHFILVVRDTVTLFDFMSGIASQKSDCTDVIRVIPGSHLYLKTSQGSVRLYSDLEQANISLTPSLFAIPRTSNIYTTDPAQLSSIQAHIGKIPSWTHNIGWSDCGRFFVSCMREPEPWSLAVSCIADNATSIKDVKTFVEFPPHENVGSICTAISHGESNTPPQYAVCAGNRIQIWCTKTCSLKAEFIGHHRQTDFVAFSFDNQYLVSGAGNIVKVWDWQHYISKPPMHDFYTDHSLWLTSVSFSEGGDQFVSSSWDKLILLWKQVENNTFKSFCNFTTSSCPLQASFAPNGDVAYVLSEDGLGYGAIKFWDPINNIESSDQLSSSWGSHSFMFAPTSPNRAPHFVTKQDNGVQYFQYATSGHFELVVKFSDLPAHVVFSPAGTLALVFSNKILLYHPAGIISEVGSQLSEPHPYDYEGDLYVSGNRIFLHCSDSIGDGELVWVPVSYEDNEIEVLELERESKGFYMRDGWVVCGDGKVYAWVPQSYGRGKCHDIHGNKLLLGGEDGQVSFLKIG